MKVTGKITLWFKDDQLSENSLAYLLIMPALLFIFGLGIFPLGYTLWLSLQKMQMGITAGKFIGLDNYIGVLKDGLFWKSMSNTLYFAVVSIAVQMVLGIAVAMLLNQKFKGRGFVRAIVLAPWAVPTIVNASLWGWIYNASYGVLNRILISMHIIPKGIVWLGSANLAMNMIIVSDTWRMLPLYVLMFLASLQTMSSSVLEAADMDGANFWYKLKYIYLPLLKPMILIVLVLRTIQALRVFDIIYALTQGGPANGTMVISFYSYYQIFKYLNFGYGSAVAVIVAMFTLLVTLLYMRLLRSENEE
jgi:multiple sugar transport system permease protein